MPRTTTVECANCYTTFNHIEVHGREAVIPAVRCFYPGCPVELCPSCEQFACDGCGHAMCDTHRIPVTGDLSVCLACLPDCLDAVLPDEALAIQCVGCEATRRDVERARNLMIGMPTWACCQEVA